MTHVETLDCRSPSRCRTCEHWQAPRGCALEDGLEAALLALAAPHARPRGLAPVELAWAQARRASA